MNTSKSYQGVIAFHREFVGLTGSVHAALLLSQMLYWANRPKVLLEGTFWKSMEDWKQETGLSRREFENARSSLVRGGLVSFEYERLTHKTWYKVNHDAIDEGLKLVVNRALAESANGHCTKRTMGNGGKRQSYIDSTEITSEIHSDTLALGSAKEVNKDGSGWSDNGRETSSHNCDSSAPKGARISALVPESPIPENVLPQSELFDALVEMEGAAKPFTRSFAGKIRSAQKDILSAFPDFKASELPIFVKAYRKKFPGMQVTAKAIAKWMPTLNGVSSAKTFHSEDM